MSNKMSNKMSNSNYHELQENDSLEHTNSAVLIPIVQQPEDNIPIAIPVPDNLSNNICKICFNDTEIDDFINLTCNHKLCKDCFQKWHKTCPWCRSVIKISKNIPINNSNESEDELEDEDCCNDPKCQICKLFIFIISIGYITYCSIYLNYK